MRSTLRKRLAGAVAVTAFALGMGVVPASALDTQPTEPATECTTKACNEMACDRKCEAQFGPFASGFCDNGVCRCAV